MASSGAACIVGEETESGADAGVAVGSDSTTGWLVGEGSAVAAVVGAGTTSFSEVSPQAVKAAASTQMTRALLKTFTGAHSP